MGESPQYLLVDSSIAPEAFLKVIEVKKLLSSGRARSVSEAAARVGISRSAFYKYKNKVHPFNDLVSGSIVTISAMLRDEPGVLSRLTGILYKGGANILTINQNIPMSGVAPVSITARVDGMMIGIGEMLGLMRTSEGVESIEIISGS